MKVVSFGKKVIAIFIVVIITTSSFLISAESISAKKADKLYKNFTIFGDSICLGFSTADASMADANTYDIIKNALNNRYPHAYPSLVGQRLGLDVDATDDGITDLYNFGICAAWSSDIYKLISDPYYNYEYYATKYDENTLFTIPEDYTGDRYIVDTEAPGYDVGNPGTWIYKMNEAGTDYLGAETYTIPAGTKIHVAYNIDYLGMKYLTLNNVIAEKYFYISRKCVDKDGKYIDTNGDGKVDEYDIIYYPTMFDFNSFSFVPSTDPAVVAEYGEVFRNPEWNMYYYDFAVDKIVNGDLIALAAGGNDIYHSFMPYQQNSGTTLGNLMYWLTYYLQMNGTVGDISNMLFGEGNEWIWDMIKVDSGATQELALAAGIDPQDVPNGAAAGMGSLINANELATLLDYYSEEKVSAYFADVVANYKQNLEKTIIRMNELRSADSQLVLMSHFNPFGMRNYLEMIAQSVQNGKFFEHLSGDAEVVGELLKAFFGAPEDYEKFANLSDKQQEAVINDMSNQISNIINVINNNPNISDEKLTQMVVDLSYPVAVIMAGNGLSGVYTEMNNFVEEMANKYNLAYVDISGAPSSGRYDPHPTAEGHKWIADRMYSVVAPTIEASVCCAGTGNGKISNEGCTTLRLGDTMEYRIVPATGSKISAIYIDGELLSKEDYPQVYNSGIYVFDDVKKSHKISVQFDYNMDFTPKYSVDVLGGYVSIGGGEGLYKPGTVVTIDAGSVEGYEFTGWISDNAEINDASSAKTTFVMPKCDVRIIATWKPISENEKPQPQYNTLTFETNCDSKLDEINMVEGTIIDIDAITPPEREGYTFAGWYYDKDFTAKIHTLTLYSNTTLYAKWIKNEVVNSPLPFITAYVSPASTGYGVISSLGTSAIEHDGFKEYRMLPSEGSYISAIFIDGKWLNPFDPANKRVYDTGVYVFKNVNEPHSIMVQFDLSLVSLPRYIVDVLGSYASNSAGEGLYRDGDIVYIKAGEKSGFEFIGWEADGVELADPSSPETFFFMTDANVTVTAKWAPLYNLFFETNGGKEIDRVTLKKDSVVELKDYIPERENFEFAGWFNDENLTDGIDSFVFEGNDTIYAKWKSTVKFETLGGSKIDSVTRDEGTVIKLNDKQYIPSRKGYIFKGWYSDKEFKNIVKDYTFNGNITLYAKWVAIPRAISPVTGDFSDNNSFSVLVSVLCCAFVCISSYYFISKLINEKATDAE